MAGVFKQSWLHEAPRWLKALGRARRAWRHTKEELGFRLALRRRPLRLVVGSAGIHEKGWTPTDKDRLDLLDPDGWRRYLDEGTVDAILAEHVWEHLTQEDGLLAAATCYAFLRPGGHLRVAVPDANHPSPEYRARVGPGGSGAGAQDHLCFYTYRTLRDVFSMAGFEVRLLEYFDDVGEFCYVGWDPEDGKVNRSSRYDPRNTPEGLEYTSIVLDAIRPPDAK